MVQRFFPKDKNYILKEAQSLHRPFLLFYTFKRSRRAYFERHNPLGIVDDTIKSIIDCDHPKLENLEYIYDTLAGIYRYKFGVNQLELLFDGGSHFEKYSNDWQLAYKKWIKEFCNHPRFLKAVLETTVFFPDDKRSDLAINRLRIFVDEYFGVKVNKYRGIQLAVTA
jgi:hypothetical protein